LSSLPSDGCLSRDPATGVFLSVDQLIATTQQPYQYASDNSVNVTDPSGACWFCLIESAYWVHENFGPGARNPNVKNMLTIVISTLARLLVIPVTDPVTWVAINWGTLVRAWNDVVQKAGRRANTGTMHSQFVCHWILVREKPGRNFHLEPWRPDRGIYGDLRARCNPL
jgi:hypothetical protein